MRIVVGICTFRRDAPLRRLLTALEGMQRPGLPADDVRILVVDNDPTSETRALCRELASRSAFPIDYEPESVRGLVCARNRLVAAALERGADLVAFLDDDDVPDSDWLVELVGEQQKSGAQIVVGNRRFAGERPPSSSKSDRERTGQLGRKTISSHSIPKAAATANLLVTKEILGELQAIGPIFDPAFSRHGGEDEDFFVRAANLGTRFALAPGSMVTQFHEAERFTIRGAFRRGFKTGCARVDLARHHQPDRVCGLVWGALLKSGWVACSLPLSLSSVRLARFAYRLGKPLGTILCWMTGRSIGYYDRN